MCVEIMQIGCCSVAAAEVSLEAICKIEEITDRQSADRPPGVGESEIEEGGNHIRIGPRKRRPAAAAAAAPR